LQPTRLAVGHGKTLENPLAAMQRAIDEAKQHLKIEDYADQKAN
jgi:hypothetical protein